MALHCERVTDQRGLDHAASLRFSIFVDEGLLAPASSLTAREVDGFDPLPTTLHFVVYEADRPVAASRVLLPSGELARRWNVAFGLHMELLHDLGVLHRAGVVAAEAGRMCVRREYRRTRAVHLLYEAMRRGALAAGATHFVGNANTGTDDPVDAAIALQVAHAKGLSSVWTLPSKVSPAAPDRPGFPVYDPEERRRAAAGDLAGLSLHPILLLYAKRMGARYAGGSIFDRTYGRFAMPLVADLLAVSRRPANDNGEREAG